MQAEITRSHTDLTRQQQAQLEAALARVDSRFAERLTLAEGRMREDTQRLGASLYKTVAQQRVRDLDAINTRLDGIEVNNAIETRQTDAILNTILQVADLKLR